jgi:type 1 glutamine amidotransferase
LKKNTTFACLCLVFFIYAACKVSRPASSAKVPWKKVNILVYTKNGSGYIHDNIPAAVRSIREMGKQNGFNVDVADTSLIFTEENLKKYNALVFTSTNNDVFDTDARKVAFMRYIQAGGGFVGIHSVTGTERKWPWFKRLVGGTFVRHAKHQKFRVIITDNKNPSTSFLPRQWERNDECYYIAEINPDIHVLAVHDLSTVDDKDKPVIFGNVFPSVWSHEFDGGKQWYTALGHDSVTYDEPVFRQHILGGIQWVVEGQHPIDYSKARAVSPNDPLPY